MSNQPPKIPPPKQSSSEKAITTLCVVLGAGAFVLLNEFTGAVPGGAIGGAMGGVLGGLAALGINSLRRK